MRLYYLLILPLFFASCAVPYRSINPSQAAFPAIDSSAGLKIDISESRLLAESRNPRYERKCRRKGIVLAAVRISNNTADTACIQRERLEFFCNYEPSESLSLLKAQRKLRQRSGWHSSETAYGGLIDLAIASRYIMYGVFYSVTFFDTPGLLLPLGIYNIITASKANKRMYRNLSAASIDDQQLLPGQVFYGLVCLKTDSLAAPLARQKHSK